MNDFLDHLRVEGRSRLPLQALVNAFRLAHPEHAEAPDFRTRLLSALEALQHEGAIELTRTRYDRSGQPPLPRSARLVHILQPKAAAPPEAWIEELAFAASLPRGSMLDDLKRLNAWLKAMRDRDVPDVPLPERALEIFDNEKRFDGDLRQGHVFGGRVPISLIRAYEITPTLVHERFGKGPVLVLENQASYESFRRWNRSRSAGTVYGAICWGAGRGFSRSHLSLDPVMTAVCAERAFYLGDLDPTGLQILHHVNLARRVEKLPEIEAHLPLYTWFVENGRRRSAEIKITQKAERAVHELLPIGFAEKVIQMWATSEIVPQESFGTAALAASDDVALPY
ncbi:MAG: hypothetical protein GKS00_24850 [Alphaproteobacteria bacterium]|nr:hypothetical protein [Alphaproteobacteria bacterium]